MKIAMLAVVSTAFLHLKGPDGTYLYEGTEPVGIDVFGPGSPEFAKVEERQSSRAAKRYEDNDRKISLSLGSIEERRTESAQDLVALTAGFRHIEHESADGKPLAGAELYLAVYADPALGWIKGQVTKFVDDWGKFAPAASGS